MSGRVVALLVGIDAYLPPVNSLYGCVNDVAALERYLTGRVGDRLDLQTLLDADATRANVTSAFREHLGAAGPGDVALFGYCGHGSEEAAPDAVAQFEPTGRIQTLLLHDSGRSVGGEMQRALADKELAVLIAGVAVSGAHVVVILDCCHSGGGTRDPYVRVRGWRPDMAPATGEGRDVVLALNEPRPVSEFLPGTVEGWSAPAAPHVALAACRSFETAKEYRAGETTRGAFSVALGEALDVLGPRTTYRSLLATVGSRVVRTADDQHPELFPVDVGGAGDGLFLDGTVPPVASTFTVARAIEGWQADAGLVHGLRPPVGDEAFVLAARGPDGGIAGSFRVTAVDIGTSVVEPVDWEPGDVAYAAVVADVPLPLAEVAFDLTVDGAPTSDLDDVRRRLSSALETCGPDGGPSPYVRAAADGGDSGAALRLRVGAPAPGLARMARADGSAVTVDTPVPDEGGALLAVHRLEHVARWEQVRALGDHPSPVREAVVLDVYPADIDDRRSERTPLPADSTYRLAYQRGADAGWIPPHVHLAVRSTSEDDLYVAVLDLTDRFLCRPVLPTVRLAAGHTLSLQDGAAIPIELPAGRAVEPGAMVRDWLKVIVSDVDFDASAFDLPALDEPTHRGVAPRPARNTLERLAAKAVSRDIGAGPPADVVRWSATTVAIETVIPTER